MRQMQRAGASLLALTVGVGLASGCASLPLDRGLRSQASAGAGWGRLRTDSPTSSDVPASERRLDLADAFALDLAYGRRVTGAQSPVGVFGEGVLQWVPRSSVEGGGAAPSCEFGWLFAGAGLRLQSPPLGGIALSGDAGYGVLRAAQNGCAGNAARPGSPAATAAGAAFVGASLDVAITRRVGLSLAIRSVRLPLDRFGMAPRRLGGAGSLRVVVAF